MWSVSLDAPPVPRENLERYLSKDETERAARFVFADNRARFEVAHGLTRWILGAYASRPPEDLEFSIGSEGKPALAGSEGGADDLHFNSSDSKGHFLIGVTRGVELGVDVEWRRPVREVQRIADRFFSPAEAALLRSVPAERRERAFFECWTRKEAFVKAVGGGLQIPLDSFEVTFAGESPALRHVRGSEEEAAEWSVWGFDTAEDAATAAVVVRATGRTLIHVPWQDAF